MQGAWYNIFNPIRDCLLCFDDFDTVLQIEEYVSCLSDENKYLFVQSFLLGKTNKEIAESLSPNNVFNMTRRIQYKITKLRKDVIKNLLTKEGTF